MTAAEREVLHTLIDQRRRTLVEATAARRSPRRKIVTADLDDLERAITEAEPSLDELYREVYGR